MRRPVRYFHRPSAASSSETRTSAAPTRPCTTVNRVHCICKRYRTIKRNLPPIPPSFRNRSPWSSAISFPCRSDSISLRSSPGIRVSMGVSWRFGTVVGPLWDRDSIWQLHIESWGFSRAATVSAAVCICWKNFWQWRLETVSVSSDKESVGVFLARGSVKKK